MTRKCVPRSRRLVTKSVTEAMAAPADPTERPPESRAGLLLTDRMLTIFISLLVLVQATLAGHSSKLFGSINIEIHGMVGNAVFTLLVVSLVIAAVTRAGTARLATV